MTSDERRRKGKENGERLRLGGGFSQTSAGAIDGDSDIARYELVEFAESAG